MGIDRDTLAHMRHLLRPLATRVANAVARAVVQLVDDGTKLQLLQVGVLADETIDGAEHHQPYGFSSVPLAGAEAVVVFPNGDRSHPLVIATSDRRYRPTAGEPGQVGLYHYLGAKLTMLANGKVVISSGGATETTIKADTYRTAEDVMLTAVAAAFTAAASAFSALGAGAAATACTAAATAITTFQGAAATYKSTVLKVQ